MKISRRTFMAASVAAAAAATIPGVGNAQQIPPETTLQGEDGYKLWLRYAAPPDDAAANYRKTVRAVVVEGSSPTAKAIVEELNLALPTLLGNAVPVSDKDSAGARVIIGTSENSPIIKGLSLDTSKVGKEGFVIRSTTVGSNPAVVIASDGEIGALYGMFHFLRLMQSGQSIENLQIEQKPRLMVRMVDQWDNLSGTIERGYGGRSIYAWKDLPDKVSPRYKDYARANAAIGINSSSVNNVNADIAYMRPDFLPKLAALADIWRPYGVRLFISANFSAPKTLGGLSTADPLDDKVIAWWNAQCEAIYKAIPDFGGMIIKANSEGQPGPKDYGRTHAEGANVVANALAPHGGYAFYRAFVYDEDIDPDRTKRAYIEFTKLDGQFKPNVLIQIKNGPLDFQPREPFHPLFGALKQTSAVAEVQPTQEYLGQGKHLVYLGTMWKEFLDSDTYAKGEGSTVGKYLEGSIEPMAVTGMVGVTNPGLDPNWVGHHFCQANWYALGRLAWDHTLTAEQIAEEWTRVTFTNDASTVATIVGLMMPSREIFLNYTMPIGLHHLIGGDHYAPMPWNGTAPRPDWTAVYYHHAAADGIGFDRTKTGSNSVAQYFPPVHEMFEDLDKCPDRFLLWFHHLPWDYKMRSGKTLWTELCEHYYGGVAAAAKMQATWATLAGKIDPRRHKEVADRLDIQVRDAGTWRDRILQYFQGFSKLDIVKPQA